MLHISLRALLIQKDTKLNPANVKQERKFESFANSKRYKTILYFLFIFFSLRALLIQKDTKLDIDFISRILV